MENLIKKVYFTKRVFYKPIKAKQIISATPEDAQAAEEIFKLLYEYQNTGLTPEQVNELKSGENASLIKELDIVKEDREYWRNKALNNVEKMY